MKKFKIFFLHIILLLPILANAQDWVNNKIGVDSNVPAPWVPLKVIKNGNEIRVSCWNRVYVFDNNSLLKDVLSGGESFLTAPVDIGIDNKNISLAKWSSATIQIDKQEPDEVILTLKQTSAEGIIRTSNVKISYDGLAYFDISLQFPKGYKNLTLNIPVKRAIATDVNRPLISATSAAYWKADKLPVRTGVVDNTRYVPYVWLGNYQKGIFWFCESPENWGNYLQDSAIQLVNSSNTVALKANFNNDTPAQSSTNWNFKFGIQATPVKPFNTAFRAQQLGALQNSTINILWPSPQNYSVKYFGYPEPQNLEVFNQNVEASKKGNKKVIAYGALTYISSASPEWQQYKKDWSMGIEDNYSGDVRSFGSPFVRVNIDNPKFSDFIVWKSKQFLKETNINGFYLDNSILTDFNDKALIRPARSGQKLPYYPILTYRKNFERFYKMVKGENPNNIILVHCSARVLPPVVEYADAFVDGEQFKNYKIKLEDDYLAKTSIYSFQTEFSGKNMGVPGIFLPEFTSQYRSLASPTKKLATLLLLHDINAFPIWSNTNEWVKRFNVLKSFDGIDSADFIPYYSKSPFLISKDTSVYVSCYKNNRNEYLCIIGNLSNSKKDGVVVSKSSGQLSQYVLTKLSNENTADLQQAGIQYSIEGGSYVAFKLSGK